MKKGLLTSSFVLWTLFAAGGVFLLASGYAKLRYGIDLVGGQYITLDVKTDEAVQSDLAERIVTVKKGLKKYKLPEVSSAKVEGNVLEIKFAKEADAQLSRKAIKAMLPDLDCKLSGSVFRASFPSELEEKIKTNAVNSVRDVLERRLNPKGASEVMVATKGKRNIVIELPNVKDPEKAKAMIGTPAKLEFKIVEHSASSEDALLEETDGEIPEGMMVVPGKMKTSGTGVSRQYFLLPAYPDLTGKLLLDSYPGFGGGNNSHEAVVNFKFSSAGAEQFGDLTAQNYGRRMAIVVDDEVISDPTINDPIYGGSGYIHGSFTWESAQELSTMLKTGAFVARVEFVEERAVRATLGDESIRKGIMSCLIGLGLLFLFSLYYYGLAGLFAFIALLFNMVLVLLGLSWIKATLTLPGIAGMVLTVGMAIDASILIYERIKEELLHSGMPFKGAVAEGFKGAIGVILDSNITTFIVGIVLYNFGTGQIQGFAVTTMLGIVATLLTGLFFLRSIFDFVLNYLGYDKIKI